MEHREIPLLGRDGTVRGVAIVDADDYDRLAQHRWHLHAGRYVARFSKQHRLILMHREILDAPESHQVDHISRDGLDNRKTNLRIATAAENLQNKSSYRGSSSAYRGVHWDAKEGKWCAQVRVGGRKVFRRWFTDEEQAALAVAEARQRLMTYSTD